MSKNRQARVVSPPRKKDVFEIRISVERGEWVKEDVERKEVAETERQSLAMTEQGGRSPGHAGRN